MDRDTPEPTTAAPVAPWPTPRTLARWMLVSAALFGVLWLVYTTRTALLPFVFGAVLAYLLLAPVNALSRSMPRWAAILTVYAVGFGFVIALIAYVVPLVGGQISRFITAIPRWYDAQAPWVERQFQALIAEYRALTPIEIQQTVEDGINNAVVTLRTNAISYLSSLGNWLVSQVINVVNTVIFLFGFAIVPFWLFYVLNDQQKAVATLNAMLPRSVRTDFWNVWALVDRSLIGYIRGQLLLGLIVGSCAGFGLMILNLLGFNVDFVLLLAITAGLTELIPYVGPLLGAIPAVLVGMTDGPTTALAVVVLYFLIQQLENQFLVPRIVGESLNVHPAVLMVTLIIGVQMAGLVGVILSPPLTAIARDVFLYLYNRLREPASPQSADPEARPLPVAPPDMTPGATGPPAATTPATGVPVTERTIPQ